MIVVFGSLNVDIVLNVKDMPTPGETVLCQDYQLFSGGKGANQAVAAAKAGAEVKMFGSIGADSFGEIASAELRKAGVDINGINQHPRPTGCATICVDSAGENMITVASGANLAANAATVPDKDLSANSIVILQMEVPAEQNFALITRAAAKGARVILNLAPAQDIPQEILQQVSILVVNEIEVNTLALNLKINSTSATMAAQQISAMFNITCIVTLGAQGAQAFFDQQSCVVSAMEIKPVDTTAAGDSFVGALAASLDKGETIQQALHFASIASGLTCLKMGAQSSLPLLSQIQANL